MTNGSSIAKYGVIIAPVGTGLCLLYLFGYWGSFGINALDYIGLADVVRLSLYPMIGAAVSFAVGYLIALYTNARRRPAESDKERKPSPIRTLVRELLIGTAVAAAVFLYLWGPDPAKWFIICALAPLIAHGVADSPQLANLVPNEGVRTAIIGLAIVLPCYAFGIGRFHAEQIKAGKSDRAVVAERLPAALELRSTPQQPILYAGHLGQHVALFETLSSHLVLVREDEIPTLAIREK